MKKIFALCILWVLIVHNTIEAQIFDSTAYKQAYKERFHKSYFGEEFSEANKIAGLSKAWAEAKFNFANFDLIPQVNWDSLYYAYIPKVVKTKTKADYYQVLSNFYHQLNDGHSMIIAPQPLWDSLYSTLPIRSRLLDDRVFITDLNSSDAEYEVLKPGTEILKINGIPVQEYAEKHIVPYVVYSTPQDKTARVYSFFLTQGPIDELVQLELKNANGKITLEEFQREKKEQPFPMAHGFENKKLNKDTRLLTINTFNDERLVTFLDSIFQEVPLPKQLIIDIRKNGGGNSNNGHELLGYLTDSTFLTSNTAIRHYRPPMRAWGTEPDELEMQQGDWKPYKKPTFKGEVVVLVGPDTYSAAEDFLAAFKTMNRGTVIGQTTGGSTGQPLFFELPFGGMGAVCSKRDLMPDGTEFIGIGILPDIEVKPSAENIIKQEDMALKAALKTFEK